MKSRLLLFVLFCFSLCAKEPEVLYLTWRGDPSTSIEIFWQTKGEQGPKSIEFKRANAQKWQTVTAQSEKLEPSDVWVFHASLSGLEADADYQLRFEEKEPTHLFHTLPTTLEKPLKVVIGGDAFLNERLFKRMNRRVAKMGPDFVIMGGDIAYTEGIRHALRDRKYQPERWYEFFKLWTKQMVAKNGRMIPIVPVVGNHDVREDYDDPAKRKVLFYQLFALPEDLASYRVMRVGGASFFLLDSGHVYSVGGDQAEWLEGALKEEALYKFPVYHIAAYPSVYTFNHKSSGDIRAIWLPLFEKYGVKLSFENDNHSYKRTFPLKAGKVDPDGIVYLGDGSWGVPPRKTSPRWYLAKSQQINLVWLLTLSRENCACEAFNSRGTLIDRVILPAHNPVTVP